jgi:galactonate dehydratase
MQPTYVLRRARLARVAAVQTSLRAAAGGRLEITAIDTFRLREPVSRRSYTIVRLRTAGGLSGYGECAAAEPAALDEARRTLLGQPATAYEALDARMRSRALAGAVNMALLDLVGHSANAPVYEVLGGPTRRKARALAPVRGETDPELVAACRRARDAGFRAFAVPVPRPASRNQGQAYASAVLRRLETLRGALGAGADFVLDAGGALTPGDASRVAAGIERFHLLWLDEPCAPGSLAALRKIGAESVTPLGFGLRLAGGGDLLDLLREEVADVVRPELAVHGISRIRKMAALAETYYIAVAPRHAGGPVGTAAALQLAATLPNFFIQELPLVEAAEDRALRRALVREPVEAVSDGFLALPAGPGLGVTVDDAALSSHREEGA